MKISLFTHNHAELFAGGAERAAYTLFQHLNNHSEHDATLVAVTTPDRIGHDGSIGAFRGRSNEIIWATPGIDHFTQTSNHYELLKRDLTQIVEHTSADVIHFHHYTRFGLEAFKIIKEEFGIPIVLTLHEYMLICNHNGQMMTTNMKRCRASSPAECHTCYPSTSSGKFFLREKMIKSYLKYVDHFVSPSNFLLERYVNWGIPRSKISMIENLLPDSLLETKGKLPTLGNDFLTGDSKLKIGYFGQINPYKGAPVLFDALLKLPRKIRKRVEVSIFGANLDIQEQDFKDKITKKVKALDSCVVMYGPYNNDDVIDLMRSVHWCIIPSIWWENSPIVIQEAKAAGIPMLASNIGGMKEKVIDGETGAHFLSGSAIDLSEKIKAILDGSIKVKPTVPDFNVINEDLLNMHKKVYEQV